jgi:small-conductance mechanosensitive channel
MDMLMHYYKEIWNALNAPLFQVGDTSVSLTTIVFLGLWLVAVFLLTGIVRRRILKRVLSRTGLDASAQYAVARGVSYAIMFLALLLGLPLVGIDVSSIAVVLGALGIGIGFGLQSIASNFIAGFIILISRPIRLGDRVEFGQINGDVVAIQAYHSTIRTNDNIEIIVPNSQIVSSQIINWSHNDKLVRFRIPVNVSYDADPHVVERTLLEVAARNEHVLKQPAPNVILRHFGDSGMDFELRVWTSSMLQRPGMLHSQINFGIWEMFRERGIHIPYPQRDVHLKTAPGWAPAEKA